MGSFSLIHWIIFAVFVLLLFGGKRFSNMMGDVAQGLKSFKKGMTDEDEAKPEQRPEQHRQIPPQQPIDITPRPADPVVTPPPSSSIPDDQTR
ncbi:MAG: twin-arginine translocase TatA/TatE family subunit [Sphingomicrobium sp.]